MMRCSPQKQCPFLYMCVNNICNHKPLLPPTVYSGFIYAILPIILAFINVGGLSGGFLKVPVFMDLLNYDQKIATIYTYPLTFGAGLANFFLLLPQRHLTQDKPVIDYDMVIVLFPCVVVGTTLGVLSNNVIPALAQDIIIVLLFTFITYTFTKKYLTYKKSLEQPVQELTVELTDQQCQTSVKTSKVMSKIQFKQQQQLTIIGQHECQQNSNTFQIQSELSRLLQYDKGWKFKDIIISVIVFIVFQSIGLLVQGKIYKFKICELWFYATLFTGYIIMFLLYLLFIYHVLKKRFQLYKKVGYKYNADVSSKKNFTFLVLGGFLGGFSSGLIGLGCGDLMIIFMGLIGIQTKIASATSGYQIVFVGASSLIQSIAQHEITWVPLVFLTTLAFVGSFVLSIIAYKIFDKLPNKGQGPILISLSMLSLISLIGVFPNVILTAKYYGFHSLLEITGFKC